MNLNKQDEEEENRNFHGKNRKQLTDRWQRDGENFGNGIFGDERDA